MRKIAIIPARGGSKRIPRKNIKDFLGKPIISYSIECAKKSRLFDTILVSTDDMEIKEIAEGLDAQVPFLRSDNTSDDHATTADVIEEVINCLADKYDYYDHVCCLYPTAPLLDPAKINESFELMIKGKFDSVFPVVRYSYPIQRSLAFVDHKIHMVDKKYELKRSQDLEERFHDAGQFYWLSVKGFLKHKKLFTENSSAIVLDELSVQDIDNPSDWKIAELKYKLIKS